MTLVDSIIYSGWLWPKVKIFYDDINRKEYICDTQTWVAVTTAKWKVRRITKDVSDRTTDIMVANGWEYNNVATDLATVEAFTYS